MFQGRNRLRRTNHKNCSMESLENRQLMTTAMGVDSSFDGLYEIDLDTGDVSEIGKLHPNPGRYTTPVSMAIRPTDNRIFVINNSPAQDEGLSVVDRATGRATHIGDTPASSITFNDHGQLYGIAGHQLVRVNPNNGVTSTIRGADDLPGTYGLDFNSIDGHFYGVAGNVDGEAWILKITPGGKLVSRARINADLNSVPGGISIDHGVGVVSNLNRTLFKVDLDTGNVLERVSADRTPQGFDTLTRADRSGPAMAVDAGTDSLYKIDLDTGAVSKVGPLHPSADRYTTPVSMAIRPSDNRIFVINNSPDQDAGLSVVNPSTGRATKVANTDVESITFDNRDRLYGLLDGKLAIVNPSTGSGRVLVGADNLPRLFGLDYNPEDGNLYGVTGNTNGRARLLKISTSGQLLEDNPLTEGIQTVPGAITIDNGIGVVSNLRDTLYKVNLDTGKVVDAVRSQESPQGLDIAPRPFFPQRPQGAVLGVDSSTDSLYKIDLTTGVATKIGPLHPSDSRYTTPVSMAIRPSDDMVFVINNSPVGDGGLSTLNIHTGRATLVGDTQANSIAFDRFDNLYGIQASRLVKIDSSTGETASLDGDSLPTMYGLDYNWDDGHLYGITGNKTGSATILKINTSGDVVQRIPLSRNIGTVPGSLVFDADGQLVVSNLRRRLFDVDHTNGTIMDARNAERLPQGLAVSSSVRPGQPAELIGDLDGNGKVDFGDFLTLSGNFGTKVETRAEGDLTGDCEVDFEDFLMLSGNFGAELPPSLPFLPELPFIPEIPVTPTLPITPILPLPSIVDDVLVELDFEFEV